MTKKLPSLTELTADRLSFEFTQTFIFLQTFTKIDSTSADMQDNFVSLSQIPILARFSFSITTSTFGWVDLGRRAKVYTGVWQKVFLGRTVTLGRAKSVFHIEMVWWVFQRNVRKVGSPRVSWIGEWPFHPGSDRSESKMLKVLANYIFADIWGNVQ